MYYIDTRAQAWATDDFFKQGAAEGRALVEPVLERFNLDASEKRMLEIGCGIGRMFSGFAELFHEVWGIDVSPEMVMQAQALCPVPNARFFVGSGVDLGGIPDASVDYIFSYLVLHHLPKKLIVWNYIDEAWRVLRSGGVCQLQLRADETIRALLARHLPAGVAAIAQRVTGHRVPGSLATWAGVTFSRHEVAERLKDASFVDVDVFSVDATDRGGAFWVVARKP